MLVSHGARKLRKLLEQFKLQSLLRDESAWICTISKGEQT
jgi:hypothetical protein